MPKTCLLLFAKSSVEKKLADPAALAALLQSTGAMNAVWAYLDELVYVVNNESVDVYDTRNNQSITSYDVVYFRYWGALEGHAIAAARICKLRGVPFIDAEVLRRGSQNKLTQYTNLFEAKVPIPKTIMADGTLLLVTYQRYGFTFPCIIKDKAGTRGKDNFLIKDEAHLRETVAQYPGVTFVMQEFIPNDGDFRVIVAGDRVVLTIHRQANGDTHLNNTSQGGSAKIVPNDTLPQSVQEDCIRAAQFFGRDFAGVDIVQAKDTGKYYCFEVNRSPQIEHATFEPEKASVLAEYLLAVARR